VFHAITKGARMEGRAKTDRGISPRIMPSVVRQKTHGLF
jgi:hypothetical protein